MYFFFVFRENREDPLDDIGSIKQIMELFTVLSRRNYKQCVQDLIRLFDENTNILTQGNISNQEVIYFIINFINFFMIR